jgi:hypothetical protein
VIKLKNILIKEEVDRKELKDALDDSIEAVNVLSKSLSEFVNIFARAYKGDMGSLMKDPLFKFIMKNINAKGKINKLGAWKKHLAKLERKL